MRLSRLPSLALALALPLVAACDPADEGPPPMTAQNPDMTAAPPDAPPAAPAPEGADDGMYASGEYAIGEDTDSYDDNDPAALTDFRGALEGHGTWVDDSTYGTVWVPSSAEVGPDFVPYQTAGHWAYDDDYVWVSDYSWGWAPFHYGRWVYVDGRGWVWVAGRVYRGAWVAWGVDDGYGYVGWYPLAPPFFWYGGIAVGYSFYVGPRWVYCPRGEVFSPVVGTRVVAGAAAGPIAARVHGYVPATPGVAGPPPQRLGYSAAQVPHPSGTKAAGVARAQQFARPSTAQALGARAPSRPAFPGNAGAGHAPYAGGHSPGVPWTGGAAAGHASTPSFGQPTPGAIHPVTPSGRKPQPAPAPVPRAPAFRGGGGRGGGGFGGGGHSGGGGGGGHGGHR
ncbi:MAG TPA: DUF6600 domain-containing protein [Polyangiaceae bacterium]